MKGWILNWSQNHWENQLPIRNTLYVSVHQSHITESHYSALFAFPSRTSALYFHAQMRCEILLIYILELHCSFILTLDGSGIDSTFLPKNQTKKSQYSTSKNLKIWEFIERADGKCAPTHERLLHPRRQSPADCAIYCREGMKLATSFSYFKGKNNSGDSFCICSIDCENLIEDRHPNEDPEDHRTWKTYDYNGNFEIIIFYLQNTNTAWSFFQHGLDKENLARSYAQKFSGTSLANPQSDRIINCWWYGNFF